MFRSISLACAALVVAVGAGAAVAQSRGAALEVRTPGLTAEGSVVVAVFDKEADWKSRDRPVRTQKWPPVRTAASASTAWRPAATA